MRGKYNRFNRREFIKVSGSALALSGIAGFNNMLYSKNTIPNQGRKGIENPYTKNGRPILLIVEGNDIDKMLKAGFEKLGGLKKLSGSNREIILKPNYVTPERYPEVTSTETICSMIDIIRKTGDYDITVADGCGSLHFPGARP